MKTKLILALACTVFISSESFAASKDAATDDRGNAVRSTNGKCIRTKWNYQTDVCAPAPKVEPAAEPAPPPPPVVSAPAEPKTKLAKELNKDETTIYFDFDKSNLTEKEQGELDGVAKVLLTDKEVESVKIVAYADKMGSTEYNDKLSQKRAQAVNDYLNAKGYLKTTVAETAWLGESAPKTECPDNLKRAEKIACLQEDRRAEIVINYYNVVEVPVETPTVPAEAPATAPAETLEPKSGNATGSEGSASAPAANEAPAAKSAEGAAATTEAPASATAEAPATEAAQ